MPPVEKLRDQLEALVGTNVRFHTTDGMATVGTLNVVGDEFIELHNAHEESRFVGEHHLVTPHFIPPHWHILYDQIIGFGSEIHP